MSKLYVRSEDEGAKNLFKKRTTYRANMYQYARSYPNIVDFNLGEKFFYGRTSMFFEPIIFRSNLAQLRPLDGPINQVAKNPRAINFVADVFNQMFAQFRKAQMTGKLNNRDQSPIAEFKIYKAFESPDILYREYVSAQLSTMIGIATNKKMIFDNFDQFFKYFIDSITVSAKRIPFTRPAFIKSKYCPITCSGLAIELDNSDYTDDEGKWYKIIESPNWLYYVNLCNSYGFMIDMNYPMRIVADIDSEIMQEAAAAYGLTSTAVVLEDAYRPAHRNYMQQFKDTLYNAYVAATRVKHVIEGGCAGNSVPVVSKSTVYSKETFEKVYSDAFFLDTYFKIRFQEEESQFSKSEKARIMDDCKEVARIEGVESALDDFERILNKTFDYRGSVSYITKHRNAIEK